MDKFILRSIKLTLALALIAGLILLAMKKFLWLGGFLTAVVWTMINFLLILNILKIAILEKSKKKLTVLLMIKFPVLYLIGFLILNSRIFPVLSILSGVSLILVVAGAVKICPKLN